MAPTVVRQSVLFSSVNLFSNTDFTADSSHPFFLHDSTATAGKLTDVDLGGPLYLQDPVTGERQIIGVAISIAAAPATVSTGACPATAKSCDIWADLTADPNSTWLLQALEVQPQASGPHKNTGWFSTHPRDIVRPDGTPDWWLGEVDYTGPCQTSRDADCDHWFDTNGTSAPDSGTGGSASRDNCVGWWNPEQRDSDDDSVGDACDNCAGLANPLQANTSASFVNKTHGPVAPPSGRAAELRETMGAIYPGDGCRVWNAYPVSQNWFSQIWVNTEQDAWAVGSWGAAEHWDGQSWTAISTPTTLLSAVWGLSSNDVWAVGDYGAALHWDGTAWNATTTPTRWPLRAVWGASTNDVWAVGDYNANAPAGTSRNTILHWDGTVWSAARTIMVGGGGFRAVWGTASNDVWAGGDGGLFHWDGTQWTFFGNQFGINTTVAGLWGSSSADVWAVGSNPNTGAGAIQHWNGTKWTESDFNGVAFTAISGRAPNDVYAAASNGSVWRWDGVAWATVPTESTGAINGIAARPDGLWLVGNYPTILRRRDVQWGAVVGPVGNAMTGVAIADGTNVFGFESNGTILDYANGQTRTYSDGSTSAVRATWSDGQGHAWAVGDGGLAAYWNGSAWSSATTGTTQNLLAISGTGASLLAALSRTLPRRERLASEPFALGPPVRDLHSAHPPDDVG